MQKFYYNNVGLEDYLVLIPYLLVFYVLLLVMMNSGGIKNKAIVYLVSLGFFFTHLILLFDTKLNFIPFLPDSKTYVSIYYGQIEATTSSLLGFFYLSKGLNFLFSSNILVYVSFQVLCYFIFLLLTLKSWELLYGQSTQFRNIYFFITMFLPSGIMFSLVPLRESLLLSAFSVALYGLVKAIKYLQTLNFEFLLGILSVMFIRVQIVVYFVLSFVGVKWIFGKKWLNKILVAFLGMFMLGLFVTFTHHKLSIYHLSIARNIRVNNYTKTYGNVNWSSALDFLKDVPVLISQFLLSPLPILHAYNPLDMTIMLLDVLVVILILGVIIFNLKNSIKNFKLWLLLIFTYLFLFGIYEFHIGGAVRHRIPVVIMLSCIAAFIIESFIINYKKRATSSLSF